jgi:UDP:flavonoid glycosyltransferase YjiC (YdhE family)
VNDDSARSQQPVTQPPRRIVIASFGSLGDLHPFLALAVELRDRGHSVTIATAPHYADRIAGLGFTFVPFGLKVSPEDPALIQRLFQTARGPEYLFRTLFLPHLAEMYTELDRICEGADLLVAGEIVFAAPMLAEKTGLRWASVLLSPISFLSSNDPSVLPPLMRFGTLRMLPRFAQSALMGMAKMAFRRWSAPVHAQRKALGLPYKANALFGGKLEADRVLAMFSSRFATAQPDWPAGTLQTGFAYFDQTAAHPGAGVSAPEQTPLTHDAAAPRTSASEGTAKRLQEFLSEGEMPVIFTLGSAAVHAAGDFFHVSAGAVNRLNLRAVMITGRADLRALENRRILTVPYADYRTLFPYASAVVHQGGIGTTAEALRAGVPSLIVPFNFDQPDNAARAQRLGVAIALPRRKYNRRHAYYALHRLLRDEALRGRADALGAAIRAEDGTREAVNALEDLL